MHVNQFFNFSKYATCYFVLRIRESSRARKKGPTIYWNDQTSVSEVVIRLNVTKGAQKEYHIDLYEGGNTTVIIIVVVLALILVIGGAIIGIFMVGNNIHVTEGVERGLWKIVIQLHR